MMAAPNNPDNEGPADADQGRISPRASSVSHQAKWRFLLARLILLAGVVGLAGSVAWNWNEKTHGAVGAELAVFSTLGCGFSAGMALLVVGVTTGGPHAFSGILCSILFRTLGPLGLGVIWQVTHPDWPLQNFIEIHVPLFLVSLTVETILVVDIVSNFSSLSSAHPSGKDRITRKPHG